MNFPFPPGLSIISTSCNSSHSKYKDSLHTPYLPSVTDPSFCLLLEEKHPKMYFLYMLSNFPSGIYSYPQSIQPHTPPPPPPPGPQPPPPTLLPFLFFPLSLSSPQPVHPATHPAPPAQYCTDAAPSDSLVLPVHPGLTRSTRAGEAREAQAFLIPPGVTAPNPAQGWTSSARVKAQ